MREYGKVRTAFWTDEKIVRLDDLGKLYALYLITGPHTNMTGCFRLPLGYVAGDLNIPEAQVYLAEHQLEQAGFVRRCAKTGYVFVPHFLRHNAIMNLNQGKAVAKTVWEIPKDCAHLSDLAAVLDELPEDRLPKGFMERFRKRFDIELTDDTDNGSGNGPSNDLAIQEPEPEQKPDQEQKPEPEQNKKPENARALSSVREDADESAARSNPPTGSQPLTALRDGWDADLPDTWPKAIGGSALHPDDVLRRVTAGALHKGHGPTALRIKNLFAAGDMPDIPAFLDRRSEKVSANG